MVLETIYKYFFQLFDPILVVESKYVIRILNDNIPKYKKYSILLMIGIAILHLIAYPTQDYKSKNHEVWLLYRGICALILISLAIITYLQSNDVVIKILYYLACISISVGFCLSMGWGRPIQSKWMTFLPLLFFLCLERSFIVPAIYFLIITYVTKPLWYPYSHFDWILSDVLFSIFLTFVSHVYKLSSLRSQIISYKNEELNKKIIEQEAVLAQQSKLAEIGTLGASMAHEINNMVNYAKGSLKLVMRNKNATIGEKINLLELVNFGLVSVLEYADSILVYAGTNKWNKSENNIKKIIDSCVRISAVNLPTNVKILSECEDVTLICYAAGFSQIIINLIKNAIFATKDIQNGEIKIVLKKNNNNCILTITDNGTGIPEEIKDKLFTPFISTKGQNGSGLGLFAIKNEVEKLDGSIIVNSKVGQGTNVIITIPNV